jgi:hypothetical protein
VLLIAGVVVVFWVRRFHDYTPVEALQDLRAAARVGRSARPVEKFLELRYGPMTEPANRERAFLDFFNLGHIEGLNILAGRMDSSRKRANIAAMAQWVANYRQTMLPEEKAALSSYFHSDPGRAALQRATAQYLQKSVRFRAETAPVIQELMTTLATLPKP